MYNTMLSKTSPQLLQMTQFKPFIQTLTDVFFQSSTYLYYSQIFFRQALCMTPQSILRLNILCAVYLGLHLAMTKQSCE